MSDTAVHLVQEVLPEVPIRHWVCTFPWGVRAVLGYDKDLCREAASAFAKELSRSLKRRAKALLGLSSVDQALTGFGRSGAAYGRRIATQRAPACARLGWRLRRGRAR
jgi:hypothetical protein